jgi:hypothetical protein
MNSQGSWGAWATVCWMWAKSRPRYDAAPRWVLQLPGGDFQVRDQAQRAMTIIFMLNAGHLTRPHGLGRVEALQRLNTRFLVGTHPVNPQLMELSGLAIERTDNTHLGIKGGLVSG